VHEETMILWGRNPEARQAVFRTALTARQCDQPLASRTSSRPAVQAALKGRTYDRTVPGMKRLKNSLPTAGRSTYAKESARYRR